MQSKKMFDPIRNFLMGENRPLHDSYCLTRIWIIRGLGLVYCVAFLIIFLQGQGLWGDRGLLPISAHVKAVENHFQTESPFWKLPSLFYFLPPDTAITALGVLGILGGLVMLMGYANFPLLSVLWLLQLSFVNSGQLFYGYGWEIQLLEFTFLSFFLVPLFRPSLTNMSYPAPRIVIWAMRWMLFRLMLGAGLIKIRGDACWSDLTCLIYHYETQPNPHPLSYFFHQLTPLMHNIGTLFNHFVELVVPFGIFGPKWIRRGAGVFTILFQTTLILSGNLAWLNWLTIVMTIPCFDDEIFSRIGRPKVTLSYANLQSIQTLLLSLFAIILIFLSRGPALNLLSPDQAMNTSYDQWHLINSYGAFGSIGRERYEVIISGSMDQKDWKEYEFHCAPGDVTRRPCLITPYHYHLDWQIWFSGMRPQLQEKWLYTLAVRLLENQSEITGLFYLTPFGNDPPKYIKMDLYLYRFSEWKDWPKKWWTRTFVQPYLPPISLSDEAVKKFRDSNSLVD